MLSEPTIKVSIKEARARVKDEITHNAVDCFLYCDVDDDYDDN
jgi:hypothetical protein